MKLHLASWSRQSLTLGSAVDGGARPAPLRQFLPEGTPRKSFGNCDGVIPDALKNDKRLMDGWEKK